MKARYDLVFIGHVAVDEVHPFEGTTHKSNGGAVQYGAMAASWSDKRIAVITKMARQDEPFLEPMKRAGITLYLLPSPETTYMIAVHPTDNADQRQIFQTRSAGFFSLEDLPELEPCLAHLAGITDQEFTPEFMFGLKERGFTLSVDMQSFVRRVDRRTGEVSFVDVPRKRDIAAMASKIKLDVVEARLLTGTEDLELAALEFERWGSRETLITRSDGALVRHEGKTYFERFSNRTVEGRTGRGDSTFGAYLTRRMDHDVPHSLKFAAALASIKMETPGPFSGTLESVLSRMTQSHP